VLRCQWVKDTTGVSIDNYGLTVVERSKLGHKDDPWVLAERVAQVFCVKDPSDDKMDIVVSGKQHIIGIDNMKMRQITTNTMTSHCSQIFLTGSSELRQPLTKRSFRPCGRMVLRKLWNISIYDVVYNLFCKRMYQTYGLCKLMRFHVYPYYINAIIHRI
jgi:hypothetical protein